MHAPPVTNNVNSLDGETTTTTTQSEVPVRQTRILEPEKLYPPQPERVWLISPPSSPPLHWQQIRESKPKPGIEVEILSKLAELKPGDTVELIPPTLNAPQICVHVCEDSENVNTTRHNTQNSRPMVSQQKGKIIQTRRPPMR